MKQIGNTIKKQIKTLGFTMDGLSKEVNIDRRTISSITKGEDCKLFTLTKLLNHLGMSLEVIIDKDQLGYTDEHPIINSNFISQLKYKPVLLKNILSAIQNKIHYIDLTLDTFNQIVHGLYFLYYDQPDQQINDHLVQHFINKVKPKKNFKPNT